MNFISLVVKKVGTPSSLKYVSYKYSIIRRRKKQFQWLLNSHYLQQVYFSIYGYYSFKCHNIVAVAVVKNFFDGKFNNSISKTYKRINNF